jgi:hypothetical protein
MMRVRQLTNRHNGNAVMNHFVITDGNRTILQSYDSIVAIVDYNEQGAKRLTLGRDWDYSRTTMKYLNQFIKTTLGWDVTAQGLRKAISNKDIEYDYNLK